MQLRGVVAVPSKVACQLSYPNRSCWRSSDLRFESRIANHQRSEVLGALIMIQITDPATLNCKFSLALQCLGGGTLRCCIRDLN